MNKGSQSALVAANPLRTSNGRPFPKRRYAIRPPSTGIVAIGSPAIVQMSGAPTKAARRQSPSRQTADRHVDLRSLKSGPIFVQLRFHCRLDLFVERAIIFEHFLGRITALRELCAFVIQPGASLLDDLFFQRKIEKRAGR